MSKKQKPAGQGGRSGQRGSFDDGVTLTAVPPKCQTRPDVFARAKEQYTVLDAWRMLGLPGEPTLGTNISPLREERRPSFSIYDGGRKFKDQGGGGEQGDVIAFVGAVTGWNYSEIRDFFMERSGIDHLNGPPVPRPRPFVKPSAPPSKPEQGRIKWPADLVTGSDATWEAFAKLHGYCYPGVWVMIHAGVLRFCRIKGMKCYVVTDDTGRAAEIRRIGGKTFATGGKVYPLPGVDKSWLLGADLLARDADVLLTEGSTDFLAAADIYTRHRKAGGRRQWCPMALLGAHCTTVAPELLKRLRGRHVRLVPDADVGGDTMLQNMRKLFTGAGCPVDVVTLPRGRDLSDVKSEINPGELFA